MWAEDYPWASTREQSREEMAAIERDWGGPFDFSNAAPSLIDNEADRNWFATYLRNSASPHDAIALSELNIEIDVRRVLPAIHVSTLVLHRSGDRWVPVEAGRYLAAHIEGAKCVELAGDDHLIWAGDLDGVVDEIEEFLTGIRPVPTSERVLLTVLFTDIVGSTSWAARIGDRQWKQLLQRHDEIVRNALSGWNGEEIKTTGDGFLATFSGPTKAIQCAAAIGERLATIGLGVRAAAHTGECERRGHDLSGIAVHIASRLLDYAGDGEIVVSRTVKDLTVGAGIVFQERGEAALKGIPDTWQLYLATLS